MKRLRPWLRWLPRSLQFQLLTRSLAVLAAVLVLVGMLQYVFIKSFVYQNKASTLLRQIESIPGDMWERFDSIARRGRNDPFLFFPGTSVAYIEADGTFHEISSDKQSGSIPRLEADAYEKPGTFLAIKTAVTKLSSTTRVGTACRSRAGSKLRPR
ncbi:hypothetical protein [Cohnella faecalis]|uniref:hypothetical protein n=1 Tax=Cohnella faecalis TaxID=2315694 RepID=UPI001F296623|nr:hypothetical protein [Cohnella faecalis]